MCPIDILTGEIAVEVTGVVGVSPALWYFRYIVSIFLTTQVPVAEGGHLGWRSGSLDTIFKIEHLRTIHDMFALNWLTGFRGEDF